jgi:hypothetical protein
MEPLLRASLATLATLSVLGGVAAMVRPSAERRLERIALLLHHGVSLGVALAAGLGALLGGGDGRPLLLCAAGPLLVLCLQDAVSARVALLSVPLVATGLVAQALVLLGVAPPELAGPICAGIGVGACAAGAGVCLVRRRSQPVPRARSLLASQATALFVAAFGALIGLLPADLGSGLWAVGLGAAGAIGTAGRLSPSAPPGARDLVGALVVFALVLVVGAAAPLSVLHTLIGATWCSFVSLGAFTLVRASVDARPRPARDAKTALSDAALPSAPALAAMSPLLDDAVLRRPGRPRVIARVPARRLLDAALEKARSAQPVTQRGRRDDLLRVEVVASDGDIDVDGDPADLAEALCAVLDNALRMRAQQPDVKVQVHLRGSPASVTFEIADSLPEGAEPPPGAGIPDADGPFLHPRADVDRPGLGVALARARILVERNGGKLLTRSSAEGSTVQVTMPRRMQKGAMGQA